MRRVFKDIKGSKGNKYGVTLVFTDNWEFMPEESICTCIFGSWARWTKKNKGKFCRHIKQALEDFDNEERNKFMRKMKKEHGGTKTKGL